jgi:cobyrinic acid a,c-diamide synthase
MAGVLDLVVEQTRAPQGHGYVEGGGRRAERVLPGGHRLRGHEFHYSRVVSGGDRGSAVLRVERGQGIGEGRDGIARDRVFASYLHLHAGATPGWADGFLALARRHAAERGTSTAACG